MPRKLENVAREMGRLNIKILGFSEVRWPGSATVRTDTGVLYYSDAENQHVNEVVILINKDIYDSVLDFVPLNNRAMMLRIKTTYRIMNVIQVYAPTSDHNDQAVESFYNELEELLCATKDGEIACIIGDFNAKVECGTDVEAVGAYGLGDRCLRGDRLIQFCREQNLCVANTMFKQSP